MYDVIKLFVYLPKLISYTHNISISFIFHVIVLLIFLAFLLHCPQVFLYTPLINHHKNLSPLSSAFLNSSGRFCRYLSCQCYYYKEFWTTAELGIINWTRKSEVRWYFWIQHWCGFVCIVQWMPKIQPS
jgi:hypothetical protein